MLYDDQAGKAVFYFCHGICHGDGTIFFLKKMQKPLDYSLRMIYNNIIKRENKRNSIPGGSGERWKNEESRNERADKSQCCIL